MQRAVFVLLFGALAAPAACSLTTDLSGLSGGAPDGLTDGGLDASSDAAIGIGKDATTDESAGEASVVGFCATHPGHAVCVDFDDGALPSSWKKNVSAGTLEWSSQRASSPPGAMFATIPRRPAGDKETATLGRSFAGPYKHVVVELDMYMDLPAWQEGDINTGVLDIDLFGQSTNTGVTISAGRQYITMGTPGMDKQVAMPLQFGAWFHVKLDFDPPGGSIHATIGPYTLDQTFTAVPSDASPSMFVSIGINGYNAPVPLFAAYYDNVTIDFP